MPDPEIIVKASNLSIKGIAIVIGSLFLGAIILFAVLRFNDSIASKLFFKEIKAQMEQTIKDRDATIESLNTKMDGLNTINTGLMRKLDRNTAAITALQKEKVTVHDTVSKMHKKEISDAFTKMGY